MNNWRILLVDDEIEFLDMLRLFLRNAGYEILQATGGREALSILREEKIDLVVLDVRMPDMSGYEVCRQIKDDIMLNHIPVIMLTCMYETKDKVEGLSSGGNDYIIKPFEPAELLLRVRNLLKHHTRELGANPLTHLPGNVEINEEIQKRMDENTLFAVMYYDLNNFKAFNDKYGFSRGDEAIKLTAHILLESMRKNGTPADFIGHIGGDDFIMVTLPERVNAVCSRVIEQFDNKIPALYDKEDMAKGHITVKNRQGQFQEFPIMSIAAGVATNLKRKYKHCVELCSVAAELKKYAKEEDGSSYIVDRREK
ncbi:MAG: response regulator [Elusimicrobiota bacterium]